MNQIRKQFLIWRTIPSEAQSSYREEGELLLQTAEAGELASTD